MSSSPRNHQTLVIVELLKDLGFVERLEDGQWVLERRSGMSLHWFTLPDDPVVPKDLVIASFWTQGMEIQEEILEALQDLQGQMKELEDAAVES